MARLDTSGIDELYREMLQLGRNGGEVARVMTATAAGITAQAWRDTAQAHDFVDSGEMIESIGLPEGVRQDGGGFYADIYPQGKDSTGTRNAEKAFILHYGSSRIKPSYWVDEADKKAEAALISPLEEIWSKFLETGVVPAMPEGALLGKQTGIKKQKK